MENVRSVYMPSFNEEEFFLVTFGHSVTYPGHTYGPSTRSYYLIHYIISGKGIFKANQRTYKLHAGQGFLIEPNNQTVYTSDIDEPWTYIWVAVGGRLAKSLVESIGLSQENPIFSCSAENGKKLENCVIEMLEINNFSLADIYYRWGLLFQFISVIAAAQKDFIPKSDLNDYVSQMINYIHMHIEEPITVPDVADSVNLTRCYATTIFTKSTGMSPKDYIQNCRLTRARHMLESSSLTIAGIAYSCGFKQCESFIRAFKKRYDITPSDYRKKFFKRGRQLSGIIG